VLLELCYRETLPVMEAVKGLCFFHYCLLLPLIWLLYYMCQFVKRKYRRSGRKKRFREKRGDDAKAEDHAYLQLDKYSRGKIEKEILDLNQNIKKKRRNKIIKGLLS